MAIRTDLSVNWEVSPRIITVAAPSTSITIQDLHDTCRDIEDNLPEAQEFPHLIDSAGKEPLGGGTFVGITATLQNAKLAFEARPGPDFVSCTVTGGNLVAVDENGTNIDPIQTTAYTQVTISQSSSPTIATADTDYGALFMLESLQGSHKSVGNIFYWDPTNGNDANAGTTPSTAVATYTKAESLCTAGNHDIIFALARNGSSVTTYSTQITITKDTVKLRGPGYQFQFTPTVAGSDTITVSANSIEISGFYISTAAGGTDDGISIGSSVNNTIIKDCWIDSATGNGIVLDGSSRTKIQTCAIESAGSAGISIGDSTTLAKISQCIITGCTGDGVELAGSNTSDNIFEDNLIYNNGAYGIDIGTGVTRTGVRKHHTFSGNTSGAYLDAGSQTFIEASAGGASATEIADAVWDELIDDHTSAGSAGKTLKDAKTRATLASLK